MKGFLKLRILRRPRKRNHIADVGHSGDEHHQALKAQSETAVYTGSEFAGVEVPPHMLSYVQASDSQELKESYAIE